MNWWSFLLGHMLKRLLRALSSLGLKTPFRSSSTIAALFSSAKSSTALATWCIRYSTRSCSLFPSLLHRRLEVRRSWDFFFWRRFRRSWCLCCIAATCGKKAFTGMPFPSLTNTPSRLLSFVSRETTDSGTYGRGSVFLKAITTLSGKSVREPREIGGVVQEAPVILAQDQPEIDMAPGPYREVDHAVRPVQLVRLVLRLHEQPLDIRYPVRLPFPDLPPMVLEDACGDLEHRHEVLSVHARVLGPEVLVR